MIAQRSALVDLVCVVITVFTILLFVRVLVSWAFVFGFRPPISGPWRKLLDLLDDVTEPVLRPLRAMIPPIRAGAVGIDLSIIIAFVVLAVIRTALNC
jgi:YggT family protein